MDAPPSAVTALLRAMLGVAEDGGEGGDGGGADSSGAGGDGDDIDARADVAAALRLWDMTAGAAHARAFVDAGGFEVADCLAGVTCANARVHVCVCTRECIRRVRRRGAPPSDARACRLLEAACGAIGNVAAAAMGECRAVPAGAAGAGVAAAVAAYARGGAHAPLACFLGAAAPALVAAAARALEALLAAAAAVDSVMHSPAAAATAASLSMQVGSPPSPPPAWRGAAAARALEVLRASLDDAAVAAAARLAAQLAAGTAHAWQRAYRVCAVHVRMSTSRWRR